MVVLLYLPAISEGKLLSPSGLLFDLYPWAADSASLDRTATYNPMLSDTVYQFDPLWNADNYSGVPLAANNQSSCFFPLHLLVWLFPVMRMFTVAALIKLWLTGWFTYLFLRRRELAWAPGNPCSRWPDRRGMDDGLDDQPPESGSDGTTDSVVGDRRMVGQQSTLGPARRRRGDGGESNRLIIAAGLLALAGVEIWSMSYGMIGFVNPQDLAPQVDSPIS